VQALGCRVEGAEFIVYLAWCALPPLSAALFPAPGAGCPRYDASVPTLGYVAVAAWVHQCCLGALMPLG
jgi:hypothetical protein